MNAHGYTLVPIPLWSAWQAKCACGWTGDPEPNRPDALRHHTYHLHETGAIYA